MKILITGGTGQVGFELQRTLAPLGNIIAPTRQELNLSDWDLVRCYLADCGPDCIVNAAAYTAVDRAESEPGLTHALNATLPEVLAQYAADTKRWLIHYSSDYVYSGTGDKAQNEDAAPDPQSVYGRSKLAGDRAVQSSDARHLIFRTSWVYSARGHNFMKTMLKLGSEKETLSIVNDQYGSPTPARLIAQVTALALHHVMNTAEDRSLEGIYHVAPCGFTNWQEFAEAILQASAKQGVPLKIDLDQIKGIPTRDYPTPAPRPLNSRLALDKLEQTFGLQLPDWRQQLHQTITEFIQTT